jgi:hypothetical protein
VEADVVKAVVVKAVVVQTRTADEIDTPPAGSPGAGRGGGAVVRVAIAAIVLFTLAGIAGWMVMGPSLFYAMATGIGLLCI